MPRFWLAMMEREEEVREKDVIFRNNENIKKMDGIWQIWNDHTSYLSFFLRGQNFGLNFSPHRKCVNRDKISFATKQRKLQLNRSCNKLAQIPYMPRQNSVNYIVFYSIHLQFLHIQNFFTYMLYIDFSTSKIFPHLRYLHI